MFKSRKSFLLTVFLVSGLVATPLVSWAMFKRANRFQNKQPTNLLVQAVLAKQEIPQSIMPCLPRGKSVKKLEFEATTTFERKRYYLVNVFEEVDSFFEGEKEQLERFTTIQEDKLGCLVVIPRELSFQKSMTFYLPLSVARQLTLDFVKRRVQKAGGKEKFLQSYNEVPRDAADSPWIFFPEDVWAYEQLGMKLPQPSIIVNSSDEVEPQPPPGGY